jgi:hypothetical protein
MGGGLLQLVAYGAQDVFLTGNPQITFFKVVYRRHTNFSMEAIEQSFNGNNVLGSSVSVHITRNGDLIHRIYFNAKLRNSKDKETDPWSNKSNTLALVPYFGQRLLKTIELEIGGQRVDKHYSEWLYIWNELTLPPGKKEGYQLMVGGDKKNRSRLLKAGESHEVYVPLEFWFCRNIGLALPLIALQYHEVKINIQYATAAELVDKNANVSDVLDETAITSDNTYSNIAIGTVNNAANFSNATADALKLENVALFVDYIFLDTDERRRFAQQSHEYLVEQLQFPGPDSITASSTPEAMKSVRMVFNHPCKEIIWTIKGTDNKTYWNNFSDNADNLYEAGENPVLRAKIQLNGNDRFTDREGVYFSTVQPYQHHECTPSLYNNGINVYSFAIKPEEHQPSGSLNMSRIDTAVLSVSSSIAGTISIYAVNYNVLRILSFMYCLMKNCYHCGKGKSKTRLIGES